MKREDARDVERCGGGTVVFVVPCCGMYAPDGEEDSFVDEDGDCRNCGTGKAQLMLMVPVEY